MEFIHVSSESEHEEKTHFPRLPGEMYFNMSHLYTGQGGKIGE